MENLSPAMLALLYSRVTPTNAGSYIDFSASPYGRAYTPTWEDLGGIGTGEAYSPNTQITAWTVYDLPPNAGDLGHEALNGKPYAVFDAQGKFLRTGIFEGLETSGVSKFVDAGGVVALLAIPFALTAIGVAGAAGAAGTAGTAAPLGAGGGLGVASGVSGTAVTAGTVATTATSAAAVAGTAGTVAGTVAPFAKLAAILAPVLGLGGGNANPLQPGPAPQLQPDSFQSQSPLDSPLVRIGGAALLGFLALKG